jgi:NitT/TauT family transport system substrate-binding protein
MRRALVAFLLLGVSAIAAASASATPGGSAATLTPLNVCIGVQVDYAPVFVGLKLGIWKKHGLDVKVKTCPTSPIAIASQLNGDVDVANNSVTGAANAIGQGIPIKLVAPVSIQPTKGNTGVLVKADSPYRTFADLSGKTLGTLTVQGLFHLGFAAALQAAGKDPKSIRVVGQNPADLGPLLDSGRVDAVMIQDPQLTLIKREFGNRFRDLGNPFAVVPWGKNVIIGAFTTAKSTIEKKPDVLRRFRTAWQESVSVASKRTQLTRQIIPRYTTLDAALIREITWPKFTATGLTPAAVGPMLKQMKEYGWLRIVPSFGDLYWNGK